MKVAFINALFSIGVSFALNTCYAQTSTTAPVVSNSVAVSPDLKLFEVAATLSTSLISWASVMFGGSILAILSASYHRPKSLWIRCAYFAFVPAWFCLAYSIYAGTRVESVHVAALYQKSPNLPSLKDSLNADALSQIFWMELGLAFLGAWLIVYLSWWVFNKEPEKERQ
jgi:hypothetical protein